MDSDFTFIGNQYRLALEDQEYFIDLLLFHRELQCLVAVELKITEFQLKYAGKMNLYLSLLNERVKKPIGVATYTLTDTLPAELRPFLPSNEELVQRLNAVTAALQGPASPAT